MQEQQQEEQEKWVFEMITGRDLSMEMEIEKMGLTKRSSDLMMGRFFHVFIFYLWMFGRWISEKLPSSRNERRVLGLKGVCSVVA